jgi:hypothetical protein
VETKVKGEVEEMLTVAVPILRGKVPPAYDGLRRILRRASSAPLSATTRASFDTRSPEVDARLVLIIPTEAETIARPINMMIKREVRACPFWKVEKMYFGFILEKQMFENF